MYDSNAHTIFFWLLEDDIERDNEHDILKWGCFSGIAINSVHICEVFYDCVAGCIYMIILNFIITFSSPIK